MNQLVQYLLYVVLIFLLKKKHSLKIGTVYSVNGHVQIISPDKDIGASKAIVGRSIYSNESGVVPKGDFKSMNSVERTA